MADNKQVPLLLDSVREWNRWRKENPKTKADLRWANLHGANLSESNLHGADLSGADLRWADLRWANLRLVDLSGADLSGADLRKASLRLVDLSGASLSGADLRWADLRKASLRLVDLSGASLRWADLRWADLRWANLHGANLSESNLHGADLSESNLSGADLRWADLSGAQGLLQPAEWLREHFEIIDEGIVAYKAFSVYETPPEYWDIKPGSKLHEECNMLRTAPCGCGINVATVRWIKQRKGYEEKIPIWKVLVPWRENLGSICVPYNTDGKFRCSNIVLLSIYQDDER